VEFLGAIPLVLKIRQQSDAGEPIALQDASYYQGIAEKTVKMLD
jgi:hypothetical protein